ncbi:MAG: nitroreductase family protein [Coriobacteriaceae bacterium]|jgi:nitroreductase|nr:nitroreductase family protein [Coriobacteriaceae bacterium]
MKEIFERRSVREFTDQPVEPEKVEQLLRAGMQAPSAGNQQPWEFVVVDDPALKDALCEASPYTGPLKRAPLGIVVLARTFGLRFPEDVQSDLSAVTQNILLEAVSLGLGACWLGIFPIRERMDVITQALALPAEVEPFSMIAIGYPATQAGATPRFDPDRVHTNGY